MSKSAHLATSLKRSKPGKRRLIIDLSSPVGWSVINDGIDKEECSISYRYVVDHILEFDAGVLMAKIDFKQAYHIIPVHPDDRVVQWKDGILVDKVFPFGLESSPTIFSAVADAL